MVTIVATNQVNNLGTSWMEEWQG